MWAFRQLTKERDYSDNGPKRISRAQIIELCTWHGLADDKEFMEDMFAHIAGLDEVWLNEAFAKIKRQQQTKSKRGLSDGNKSEQLRKEVKGVRKRPS